MQNMLFNDSLTMRFNTLERNIKAKSNSFYDSYLDLLEATIKYFLDENKIAYDDSRTCGYLVKEESIKNFLLVTLKIDDYTYNKLPDYIKNFDLINYYIDYIKCDRVEFDANYFSSIFGETEKLNNEYKEEVIKLKDELKESYETNKLSEKDIEQYKSLLSIKDIELLNLDDQNRMLQTQIDVLKDIKISSMEEKLNKALDMLVNLNNEIQENRVATDAVYRSITGGDIKTAMKRIKENK